MGGVSEGRLRPNLVNGRNCLYLSGHVSLEYGGGFLQASLDLAAEGAMDAFTFNGIELDVYGNDASYNLHLRTIDTHIVWQSYRATFQARPMWQTLRIPFGEFQPYRIDRPLDTKHLTRLGIVAIGREMAADICMARVGFYA